MLITPHKAVKIFFKKRHIGLRDPTQEIGDGNDHEFGKRRPRTQLNMKELSIQIGTGRNAPERMFPRNEDERHSLLCAFECIN